MPMERTLGPDGILTTRISGRITFSDMIESLNSLSEYRHLEPIYEIMIHHPENELVNFTADNGSKQAGEARAKIKKLRIGGIAVVAEQDLMYGLCRRGQGFYGDDIHPLRIFRDERSARAWITSLKRTTDKG